MAFSLAKSLREAGVNVVAISDARPKEHTGESKFTNGKTPVYFEKAPYRVFGNRNVKAVSFGSVNNEGFVLPTGKENKIKCDLLCISGGFDPNLNLISQSGATIKFDTNTSVARVSNISNNCHLAGSVTGENDLSQVINSGISAVGKALEAEGFEVSHITYQDIKGIYGPGIIRSVSAVLSRDRFSKQFVDLHNDVIVGDISLAVQEGYKSVEHLKRYTTSGMGPDQGKTSNFNTLALLSKTLKKPTKTLQTTTYRPPYTPVTFGALAGRDLGQLAEPVRRTALHSCHESLGAVFEDVGQWKRPWYYPKEQETMYDCVNRECNIVRNSVGIFDASTLGKIEINGPDVGTFLNRVYINRFDNLKVGSCRYGLMLGEDGMIVDDGVSARISESKWFMTTTTGNAALIFDRLEELLQCDWPSLKVFLTSVSGQWSTITVAGPNSRFLMSKVTEDVDLANEKFPHLSWRNAKILDIPVRIFRVSYTGELSFEVNVPSGYAELVWQTLMCAGDEYGILPFGTEALHSLRAEKGYIAIGHETDGTVTPDDLGLGGMIKKKEDFIGARSLLRSDTASKMRHQLVGLFPDEKVLEGSPIIDTMEIKPPITKIGHITSSYFSSTLKKPIALALVQDGRARIGSIVQVALPIEQRNVSARVVSSVFYDPEGERIND